MNRGASCTYTVDVLTCIGALLHQVHESNIVVAAYLVTRIDS